MSRPVRARPLRGATGVGDARDLAGVVRPPQWVAHALCARVDPELFYPQKGGSTRDATRICTRCPVRPQCLAYALDRNERFGVWGGLSAPQRHRRAGALTRGDTGRGGGGQGATDDAETEEVDAVVVARLIAGHPVAGATRTELAHAALGLRRSGLGAPRIATRLGVGERQVRRWLAHDRTGTPPAPQGGHRPGPAHQAGAA